MFDIGFSELLLFGIIALIVLGPEKLPKAARTAGQWYAKMRRAAATIQSEIEAELDLAETRQQMQEELAKIRQTEENMKREMAEMRGNMKAFESSQNESLHSDYQSSEDKSSNHSQEPSENPVNPNSDANNSQHRSGDHNTHKDDELSAQASPPIMTRPWENMWFRLGAYDKARRLPAAPRLPNYQADALLYNQESYTQKPTQPPNETEASHLLSAASLSKQETAE